jgi:hypothetical protein
MHGVIYMIPKVNLNIDLWKITVFVFTVLFKLRYLIIITLIAITPHLKADLNFSIIDELYSNRFTSYILNITEINNLIQYFKTFSITQILVAITLFEFGVIVVKSFWKE